MARIETQYYHKASRVKCEVVQRLLDQGCSWSCRRYSFRRYFLCSLENEVQQEIIY
jgi:hypothetical protein